MESSRRVGKNFQGQMKTQMNFNPFIYSYVHSTKHLMATVGQVLWLAQCETLNSVERQWEGRTHGS